ncbi:MAG: hypothetical protein QGG38_07455, partial [Nitrospinaceae bacterium]|nr:hypothetical protein [Nitrospinaceae bacterium]
YIYFVGGSRRGLYNCHTISVRQPIIYRLTVFAEGFCLFDDSPRSATARTISKSRVLEFCREDMLSPFEQKPRIGVVVMKNTGSILCVRLRSTNVGLRNSLLWSG